MPIIPNQSAGKKTLKNVFNPSKKTRDNIYTYFIFVIIAIEFLSMFLKDFVFISPYKQDKYLVIYYPLLTQIEFFLLTIPFLLNAKSFLFCKRKKLAYLFLTLYFLFQILVIVFQINYKILNNVAAYGFITVIAVTGIMSINKKNKK